MTEAPDIYLLIHIGLLLLSIYLIDHYIALISIVINILCLQKRCTLFIIPINTLILQSFLHMA
jgi:hypothetical protein